MSEHILTCQLLRHENRISVEKFMWNIFKVEQVYGRFMKKYFLKLESEMVIYRIQKCLVYYDTVKTTDELLSL